MKVLASSLLVLLLFAQCMKGQHVDLIVHNATIHTMNDYNDVEEAMAIRDGEIIEIGPERQINNKYSADEYLDAENSIIYPGLIDAHGHMMSYARMLLSADLFGSTSMQEIVVRLEKYDQKSNATCLIGRGWDQTNFSSNEPLTNEALTKAFPNKPVLIYRVDGHAAIANDAALKKAGIIAGTIIPGGRVDVTNGKCSGLLLDNAITRVSNVLPDFNRTKLITALQQVEQELFQFGITGVHEAGVDFKDLQLLRSMSKAKKISLNLNVMLFPTKENIAFAQKKGIVQEQNLTIRSFKIIGDGALGSRGALLKNTYSDDPHNHGILTTSIEEMDAVARIARSINYQVNIHAIGDSTNQIALGIITKHTKGKVDHRWRIEHAQVIDPADFFAFAKAGVIPSVQPVHAVSDHKWVAKRIGKERMVGAYAYQTLLNQTGVLAIGSDFPYDYMDPMRTIYSAVKRMNTENAPLAGFLTRERISIDDCLKGMTVWAAMAGFNEDQFGTLEKGKQATFVLFPKAMEVGDHFASNYARIVYVKGVKHYSQE
ncbi:MAG: amidohydrolase [Moraxellaceae bacterium]